MTRVDFYILQDGAAADRLRFVCRLTEKAWRAGHQVFVQTATREQAMQLDELLWTFRAGSFVPHALTTATDEVPIVIGERNRPNSAHDLLVNLTNAPPDAFRDYQRVAEIIDQDEDNKKAGRERFRFYKDNGCELETHTISSRPSPETE